MFLYSFYNSRKINYHSADDEVENPSRVPCILHLDSIKGSHKGGLVNIFPRYTPQRFIKFTGILCHNTFEISLQRVLSKPYAQEVTRSVFAVHYWFIYFRILRLFFIHFTRRLLKSKASLYHEYLLYSMSDLLKCQSCDHSYLHEEWKARQGNTTIDLSRASNMQLLSLEVLLLTRMILS